jgi:hypothetical protein
MSFFQEGAAGEKQEKDIDCWLGRSVSPVLGAALLDVPDAEKDLALAAQRREHRCDFPACDKVNIILLTLSPLSELSRTVPG